MRSLGSAFLLLALVTSARADPPTARLVYSRGDALGCPDEGMLRNTVSARLGYDPFRDDAPVTVTATLHREGRGLRARVELSDAGGHVTGSRLLSSPKNDCSELASTMALAISIAVDPMLFARPPPPEVPVCPPPPPPVVCPPEVTCPPPPPPVVCPPPPPPVVCPPPPPPPRVHLRAGIGVHGAFGAAPGAALGFHAQVGFAVGALSLAVEGRADLPAPAINPGDPGARGVQASLLVGELVPCYQVGARVGGVGLCGLVAAGVIRGQSVGTTKPATDSAPWAAGGVRVSFELPLYRALGARVHGDLLAPFVHTTLQVNGADAWVAPVVTATLGLDLTGTF